MAYITVGSTFTPFTYEEKVRPFLDYAEAYENMYKNIEQLEEEDDWIEYIKNDPEYSALYSQYLNNLESLSNELNTSGLNSEMYSKLRNLKNSYKKNLAPVKTRVDRKKMLAEEQRKLKMANPNMHFDVDYSSIDVSNPLLDNPEASYNTLDGSIIESSTIKLGAPLAKQLRNPNDSLTVSADKKFLLGNQKYGYSREEMGKAVSGDPNAPTELLEVVQAIKDSYNYDEQSEEFKGVIDNYIYRGLQASASEVINPIRLNNPNYMTSEQAEAVRISNEINRRRLAEADIHIDRLGNVYTWDPTTEKYVLSKEAEEKLTQHQKMVNGAPYASAIAYVMKEWDSTGNIIEEGKEDLPGFIRGRSWSSRSSIVSNNNIDLNQINGSNYLYVVSDMERILKHFDPSKSPSEIQKALQDDEINLPLKVIELIQNDHMLKYEGIKPIPPFDGRSLNTMYLVKVNAMDDKGSIIDRGTEGGTGDYIIINEAGAKKLNPRFSSEISAYNAVHNQPATNTSSTEISDPIAEASKAFAAAGSK